MTSSIVNELTDPSGMAMSGPQVENEAFQINSTGGLEGGNGSNPIANTGGLEVGNVACRFPSTSGPEMGGENVPISGMTEPADEALRRTWGQLGNADDNRQEDLFPAMIENNAIAGYGPLFMEAGERNPDPQHRGMETRVYDPTSPLQQEKAHEFCFFKPEGSITKKGVRYQEKACQFEVEVNKCVVLALYQANPKQGWLSLSVRFANETRQHEAVKFDEAAYTDVRKRSALVDEPKDFEGKYHVFRIVGALQRQAVYHVQDGHCCVRVPILPQRVTRIQMRFLENTVRFGFKEMWNLLATIDGASYNIPIQVLAVIRKDRESKKRKTSYNYEAAKRLCTDQA